MTKITKRAVEAAAPRDKEYYIWDEDIPGLGLRVLPSGRRQYIVQYRAGRRSRRISLGPSTVLNTEQARSRALAILADARSGKWTCNGFVPVTYFIMPPWLRTRAD